MKHQAEAERVIRDVSHDIIKNDGRFELVDSTIGNVTKRRFPYVSDAVKLNRKRLEHMLTQCSDWTEADSKAAHQSITAGSSFHLAVSDDAPKR